MSITDTYPENDLTLLDKIDISQPYSKYDRRIIGHVRK